jgi:branched-chain amino acid transport system substrate-binding protein
MVSWATGAAACVFAAVFAAPGGAEAQSQAGVKIGMLTSLGSVSAAMSGPSSVEAIKMAIDDFGGSVLGQPITLIVGDHLDKPDVGLSIARQWFDTEKVDAIVDVNNSAVALAVNELAREKNKIFLAGAATSDLIGEHCSATTTQWIPDTYAVAHAGVLPVAAAGNGDWFFLTVDYAFGHSLEENAIRVVEEKGGKVVGAVRFPPNTTDFSSFLIEAQSKGAKTLGLVTSGSSLVNIVKQANEFGGDFKIAPFFLADTDVKAIGLDLLGNVSGVTPFYWDRNAETRAWSLRFEKRFGRPPTFSNEQHYNAVSHYLQAVQAAGTKDAQAVGAKMREMPLKDASGVSGYVREDGRVMKDMFAYRVKSSKESKGDWDLLQIVATVSKDDINIPLRQSACPLVKK